MQDPETYLSEVNVELPCAVDPSRPAILDAAHRILVNHEVYFFSSEEARAAFLRNPLAYCGLVTDPVTGRRFHPTRRSPKLVYAGRPYYFETRTSRKTFRSSPVPYKNPVRKMPEMMTTEGAEAGS